MWKFLLLFFAGLVSAQQTCKLSFESNSLTKENEIIFIVKNNTDRRIRIPADYASVWIRAVDIQIYNDINRKYEMTGYSFDDATCLDTKKCLGRMIFLKKGDSKRYVIKIIPGIVSKAFKKSGKYRFKLSFDTYVFSGCNNYVTDWQFFQN
ncbi:hypothetical protein [Chryseobacterium luquanense]|uniref:Uncharacterized protein n=1 Tax=Chryseobacterium luquanense TaxID=2983766 RepID=A0ABT3XY65_9FLAO|nr:hypothetical protein [Chryseobacterium luquanense]MCX8530806.1 hypothetical protein [Chryseobacterium luquanense]